METKPVLIVYDKTAENGFPDDLDVFEQCALVEKNLFVLGYQTRRCAVSLNLESLSRELREINPKLIFNLVESLAGEGSLIHIVPAVFESLRLAFTGCDSQAIYLTSNKLLAKEVFRKYRIHTPTFVIPEENGFLSKFDPHRLYICKYVWEHASRGLDQSAVTTGREKQKIAAIVEKRRLEGKPFFFEEYIDGREFNVSMLAGRVLNIAEIRFVDYQPAELKILDYEAKWVEDSDHYKRTIRSFDFQSTDQPLLKELVRISRKIWRIFRLRGYARVDFRVDHKNLAWVLEVNANPCLSPNAGFIAAALNAGLSQQEVIKEIVEDC